MAFIKQHKILSAMIALMVVLLSIVFGFLYLTPLSTLQSAMGPTKINARLSGTIMNGEISNIEGLSDNLQQINYHLHLSRLIVGDLAATVKVVGTKGTFQGDIALLEEGRFDVTTFKGQAQIPILYKDMTLELAIGLFGDQLVVSRKGACLLGKTDVTLKVIHGLPGKMANQTPAFAGSIRCQDGGAMVDIKSIDGPIDAHLKAAIYYPTAADGEIQIQHTPELETYPAFIDLLKQLRFQLVDSAYWAKMVP